MWEKNLEQVVQLVNNSPADWVILPEVALTGFEYSRWDELNRFGRWAIDQLKIRINKPLILTIVEQGFNNFYFIAPDFCYRRPKFKLFGREKRYFRVGKRPELFSYNGIRLVPLVCFEVRFVEYWLQFRYKPDLFLVPALWGKERLIHYLTLLDGLALSTQSWVVGVNGGLELPAVKVVDGWGKGNGGELSMIITLDLSKNRIYRHKLPLQ